MTQFEISQKKKKKEIMFNVMFNEEDKWKKEKTVWNGI